MRPSTMTLAKAIAVIAFATSTNAFWRMECRSKSGMARIDPLINPGVPGEHVHAVHGGSGFSMTADSAAMEASDCTSCSVAQDKSAYWHPALYFQAANGSMTAVNEDGGMLAYYLLYPNSDNPKVTGFPSGFEMIAGSTNRRNFTAGPVPDPDKSSWAGNPLWSSEDSLSQKAIGFNCLNYAIAPEGSLYRHFLPDKAYMDANCKDGVRFELMFPSCWSGAKNADGTPQIPANKKDHMRYPSLVMTGDCPAGFETRTVSLFYEIIYRVQDFAGEDGTFIIANGDPTGYGYHGDFIMGWDQTFLQSAVDTCTNPSGLISDCPLFTIQQPATYDACNFPVPPALKSENVIGPALAKLPGNVAIEAGPAPANGHPAPAQPTAAPAAPVPTLSHKAGSSAPSGSEYLPGNVFIESSSTAPAASAPAPVGLAAAAITTPPPAPTPLLPGEEIIGTTMVTKGGQVMEMVMVQQDVTVTVESTTTISVNERRRKRHLHQHAHVGGRA